MPIIGGHKSLSSILHLSSGSQKSDGRTAFSPYTGSLSTEGASRETRGGSSMEFEASTSTLPASMSMGTSITLNVRYVAKDLWRKVTFPPGITVTQARDICMLRFNVWQQTLDYDENPEMAEVTTADSSEQNQNASARQGPASPFGGKSGGATAGFSGIAGTSGQKPQTQTQFRENYGLFWTSAGHWLEADEMLNTYPLRKGEVLELQHIVDFIPLQSHEFKYSYAEGAVYCLFSDGCAARSWQLRWAVLRCRVLRLFKKKGLETPELEIDLTQPFRLSDQEGRSWPRSLSKCAIEAPNIQSLLASLPAIKHGAAGAGVDSSGASPSSAAAPAPAPGPPPPPTSGGAGGVLVVQIPVPGGHQMHILRSGSAFDYDVWHRTLRHTLSSGANGTTSGGGAGGMVVGVGCSMSGSASISGTSNNSHGVPYSLQSSDTSVPAAALLSPGAGSGSNGSGNVASGGGAQLASLQAIINGVVDGSSKPYASSQALFATAPPSQLSQRVKTLNVRHEGYVNRKAPDGYGFRRRYCVLTSGVLYGYMHANDCKGLSDEDLVSKSDFAVALDPKSVTVEAIAWNGRYLLRVFGPESNCLRDKPGATSLQPSEKARVHCTDILATAAQAAIEQFGSTFGMLPDSRELVRLMVDDQEEGQLWAVGFNSISGLQITSHSKVILSARRTHSLIEAKSYSNFQAAAVAATSATACGSSGSGGLDHGTLTGIRPPVSTLHECDVSSETTASSSPGICRQQSLSEFFVNQLDSVATASVPAASQRQPELAQRQQPHLNIVSVAVRKDSKSAGAGSGAASGVPAPVSTPVSVPASSAAPKWIPLSIEKYIKEDEERKRHPGGICLNDSLDAQPQSARSATPVGLALKSKPSNVSDNDHNSPFSGYSGSSSNNSYGARTPPRFNWFKRRGSTSK
ncbi:hypothetical protein FB645_000516 [Coemansia sp. IMI 203386]|nr:hypothetical protein FB645_000516 [Coemansia sp. IMI 203386]